MYMQTELLYLKNYIDWKIEAQHCCATTIIKCNFTMKKRDLNHKIQNTYWKQSKCF